MLLCFHIIIVEHFAPDRTQCFATPQNYTFKMGSNSLQNDTEFTQIRQAARIIAHSDYSANFDGYPVNDLALFKLTEPFVITEDAGIYRVNTVCVPKEYMEDQFVVGQNTTITGWGALDNNRWVFLLLLLLFIIIIIIIIFIFFFFFFWGGVSMCVCFLLHSRTKKHREQPCIQTYWNTYVHYV